LLHGVQVRAETTVHCEDLLIDDSGNGQAIEAVGEGLPELNVVSALALIVESIDTVDRRALVVAAEDEEVLGVLDLVCEKQADGLERLLASVDVVAKESVVCLRRKSAIFKETEEIVVLAMNITADLRARDSSQHIILQRIKEQSGTRWLTLIGASSSRRMGWEMKISRALVQR